MPTAIRASNQTTVHVNRDTRVRAPIDEADAAEMVIRVVQEMGLTRLQTYRVLRLAARSQRSFYRDWEKAKSRPFGLVTPEDE